MDILEFTVKFSIVHFQVDSNRTYKRTVHGTCCTIKAFDTV